MFAIYSCCCGSAQFLICTIQNFTLQAMSSIRGLTLSVKSTVKSQECTALDLMTNLGLVSKNGAFVGVTLKINLSDALSEF